MQAPACSMRYAPLLPARPAQLRLLRPSGACTPRVQPFRHSAIPRVRRQRCVALPAQDRSGSNMVSCVTSCLRWSVLAKRTRAMPGCIFGIKQLSNKRHMHHLRIIQPKPAATP